MSIATPSKTTNFPWPPRKRHHPRLPKLVHPRQKSLAGGISSSARSTPPASSPTPLDIASGKGSRIWDADGNEFIDYPPQLRPLVLGTPIPLSPTILKSQLEMGTMFGTCNTLEVEVAEQLCKMVPCAELVRFANSGSEAMCGAIPRRPRAHRPK